MDFLVHLPETINNLQSYIDFYAVTFIMFSGLVIGASLLCVLSKKLMHSAIGLLFTLFGVAGLYALLAADFLAIVQIMVYIGGILTLIIFGVMLISRVSDVERKVNVMGSVSIVAGVILAIASAAFFSFLFVTTDWIKVSVHSIPDGTISYIGTLLMTNYLAAFIVAAILLLVAFIGSALFARRKN